MRYGRKNQPQDREFVVRAPVVGHIPKGVWVWSRKVITAGILAYAVKENKPVLGLLIAITLHTGFNLVIYYAGTQ